MNAHKFVSNNFIFNVEKKSETNKDYYVTGYITTDDKDLVNDIVTKECMENLVEQLNSGNIKIDIEHEAFKDKNSTSTIPIGRIVESRLENNKVWVKAILNRDSPVFKTAWNSIKNKFLDAFSITFQALNFVNKTVDGVNARLLNAIKILNVALTGNPANPEAAIDRVFMKSIKEEMKMSEEQIKTEDVQVSEAPVVEESVKQESAPVEAEVAESAPAVEEKEMDYKAMYEEVKKELDALKAKSCTEKKSLDEIEILKKEIKSLNDKLEAPILKSPVEKKSEPVPFGVELQEKKEVNILNLCN